MGADEVAYHQATVLGRDDDHPGAALAYYGSRGETPLRWGGAGAERLGLSGELTPVAYERAFGPGGFGHPTTGVRLVVTKRPGFELVVSAHKSVAVLGVIDRADEMHSILDAETTGTMAWLDSWFQARGGRRGRAQDRTSTGGLAYAVTRHATSRAGDPSPHDHVLVANVVEMRDDVGGYKALDSASLRDTVEAATMAGRLHSAWQAVQLGYRIERDDGPSGNLRHWRITGVPDEVCETFSKRSDEIAQHLATTGQHGYRARGIAARATRSVKRHTGADQLLPGWQAELEHVGWPAERLTAHLADNHIHRLPGALTDAELDQLAEEVLGIDGRLLANHKAFNRAHLVAELAPRLYGRNPAELDRAVDRVLRSRSIVPLIGIASARDQTYTTAAVLTAEINIADTVERLADRPGPSVHPEHVAAAIAGAERARGYQLTPDQRGVVERLCSSGRGANVVIGVAGSGKTTALDIATTALESAGHRVVGASTSGQAARTLADEANIEARTFASLVWRLDHGQVTIDERTVVIVDEAGMAEDAHLARVALAVERAAATLVLVGDHRQLAAVGPGGALAALLDRRPDVATTLDHNVRQHDPSERRALAQLRDGSVPAAIDWYAKAGRIHTEAGRVETLVAMTDAWATDTAAGHDTVLLAWRRADVVDLNRLARHHWRQAGHLRGDDTHVDGGRPYAAGDRLIATAPNPDARIVTSEPLIALEVRAHALSVRTADGRSVALSGTAADTDHLDYGYALTVHRAQGATYDRSHVLAAGGGRELAYVALSRARDCTSIYATADDTAQAIDDLRIDWGAERAQRWITDRATPPTDDRRRAGRSVAVIERDLHQLRAGAGPWHDTPAGVAARELRSARGLLRTADRTVHDPAAGWRERRRATRSLPTLTTAVGRAEARWQQLGEPAVDRLQNELVVSRQVASRQRLVKRLASAMEPPTLDQRSPALEHERDLGLGL